MSFSKYSRSSLMVMALVQASLVSLPSAGQTNRSDDDTSLFGTVSEEDAQMSKSVVEVTLGYLIMKRVRAKTVTNANVSGFERQLQIIDGELAEINGQLPAVNNAYLESLRKKLTKAKIEIANADSAIEGYNQYVKNNGLPSNWRFHNFEKDYVLSDVEEVGNSARARVAVLEPEIARIEALQAQVRPVVDETAKNNLIERQAKLLSQKDSITAEIAQTLNNGKVVTHKYHLMRGAFGLMLFADGLASAYYIFALNDSSFRVFALRDIYKQLKADGIIPL